MGKLLNIFIETLIVAFIATGIVADFTLGYSGILDALGLHL
jgi:hypothetical protein